MNGVHFLLTHRCTQECDHCFVYGSPRATEVFTGERLLSALDQCAELGSVDWVFFEGGEPFLFYALLRRGVADAKRLGFCVGIVTNAYWATSVEDAVRALVALGAIDLLQVSKDELHGTTNEPDHAVAAARRLGIEAKAISVGPGDVMYRGRAAELLAKSAPRHPASGFRECPHERLDDPGRVHVDPLGFVHLCQGVTIGNLFERPLKEIVARYEPASHPVVGPLLRGGPQALAQAVGFVAGSGRYADACHLCFLARKFARERGCAQLEPGAAYGSNLASNSS